MQGGGERGRGEEGRGKEGQGLCWGAKTIAPTSTMLTPHKIFKLTAGTRAVRQLVGWRGESRAG